MTEERAGDDERRRRALTTERVRSEAANWSPYEWEQALVNERLRSADLSGRIMRMAAALGQLEGWDMLSLNAEGHGSATADAPWARALISKALRG